MENLVIQNFKFGLDARRSEMTSLPGVLEVCQNAHVNEGAEIEKRPGFFALTASGDLTNTAGLEVSAASLIVFTPVAIAVKNLGNGYSLSSMTVAALGGGACPPVLFSFAYPGQVLAVTGYAPDSYYIYLGTNGVAAMVQVGNVPGQIHGGLTPAVTSGIAFATRAWLAAFTGNNQTKSPILPFTSIGDPSKWPAAVGGTDVSDNGFLATGLQENVFSPIQGFAPYQGLLAVINRYSVQTWDVLTDPGLPTLIQVLANIGTLAPLSIQPLGDLDVLFAYDSGVRSLRVRDSSKNAFIVDLGSPIDSIIQPLLSVLTPAQQSLMCSVVEPTLNRYWLWVPDPSADAAKGTVFVLSYFPTLKVTAWSTYTTAYYKLATVNATGANYVGSALTITGLTVGNWYKWTPGAHEVSATWHGTATAVVSGTYVQALATQIDLVGSGPAVSYTGLLQSATLDYFTPAKMVVLQGRVFIRGTAKSDGVDYIFGFGYDGVHLATQYDPVTATVELPWLDAKAPSTNKQALGIDCAAVGSWDVYAGMAPLVQTGGTLPKIAPNWNANGGTPALDSSFDLGNMPFTAVGTHFKFRAVSLGTGTAKVSSLVLKYKMANRT